MIRQWRLTLSVLLMIALSACGKPAPTEAEKGDATIAAAVVSQTAPAPDTVADQNEPVAAKTIEAKRASVPEQIAKFKTRTGDLDVMIEDRVIRLLTVYSPGHYYIHEGQEKGIVAEMAEGRGEYLTAFAGVMGCNANSFSASTQANLEGLVGNNGSELLSNVKAAISSNTAACL